VGGPAALARLLSAWPNQAGTVALMGAGAGWVMAFTLFVWRYAPMMLSTHR